MLAAFFLGGCAGAVVLRAAVKATADFRLARRLPRSLAAVVPPLCGALTALALRRFICPWERFAVLTAFFAMEYHALTDWLSRNIDVKAACLSLLAGAALRLWRGDAISALAGSMAGAVPVVVALALVRGSFGPGDAALMAGVGSLLGWKLALLTLYFGTLTSGAWALALLCIGRVGRRDALPFAPFLLTGLLCACFFGPSLLRRFGVSGPLL